MEQSDPKPDLQSLREQLDRIDRELIERAAERQRIVSEIGRLKRSSGRQLRDFRREREVLEGVRAHARATGLDPGVAETLLKTLIDASLTRQETERVALSARGEGKRALVIGGEGRLGRWFVRFLHGQGFDLAVADPAGSDNGRDRFRDWRAAPRNAELIVVATPIEVSREIVEALADSEPPGLVFDVASIKAPLAETLRRAAAAGLRVCSVHPMFGPDTRLLAGRHVLLCNCGDDSAVRDARGLFDDTMVSLVEVDLAEHDRLMAWVLGLSHALNVAFAAALADSGIPAERLAEISSTTFQRQLDIAGDVTAENPELYFEIQRLNPNQPVVLEALARALDKLTEVVAGNDSAGFVGMMQRGGEWAGRHSDARGSNPDSEADQRES